MPPLHILHIEDDEDDAFFFSRALKRVQPGFELNRVISGDKALNLLSNFMGNDKSHSMDIPDLVVLDLKLPGLSGFEVLSWIRAQKAFEGLPIVVLSGSSLAQDKSRASELGASEFIVKQSDYDQIVKQMSRFFEKKTE